MRFNHSKAKKEKNTSARFLFPDINFVSETTRPSSISFQLIQVHAHLSHVFSLFYDIFSFLFLSVKDSSNPIFRRVASWHSDPFLLFYIRYFSANSYWHASACPFFPRFVTRRCIRATSNIWHRNRPFIRPFLALACYLISYSRGSCQSTSPSLPRLVYPQAGACNEVPRL